HGANPPRRHRGRRPGFLAPSVCASACSPSAAGAGSSSATLYTPRLPCSTAATVADQRELVLTDQLELLRGRRQRGARPVERAVAQYDPLGPPRRQDRLLEVPDRGYEPAYRARWRRVDRVLLALHRAAGAPIQEA